MRYMSVLSLTQQKLVFVEALQRRAVALTGRSTRPSVQAFIGFAVSELEQAVALLSREGADEQPRILRAATRLADLALDRIELAENALREQGSGARLRGLESFSSGAVVRSPSS
jgi:hypothetical protein